MKTLITALVLFFNIQQVYGFSLLVGNAGEGILSEDQVYLRDLYEAGIHLNPQFGSKSDKEIVRRLDDRFVSDLKVNKDLLIRKLTDLNYNTPDLGFYVLRAIQYYNWVLIEHSLLPFPDDGSPLATKNLRVPLANRFRNTIRIQKQLWEKLPETHKVALVIHESLSSFQKVNCLDKTCAPDTHALREIVARAFSSTSTNPNPLTASMESELNIPSIKFRLECPVIRPHVMIDRMDQSPYIEFSYNNSKSDRLVREKYIKGICSDVPNDFRITLYRDALRIKEESYTTQSGGHKYTQKVLKFDSIPAVQELHFDSQSFYSSNNCASQIYQLIDAWYGYARGTLIGDPDMSCKAPFFPR